MAEKIDRSTAARIHLAGLFGFALVIAFGLGIASSWSFLSIDNLESMAVQLPEFGLLSLAMLPAMLSGGIDLSVVATANLSAIVAALLMTTPGAPGWAALPAAVLVGVVAGLANGTLIALCRLPAILATLATMQLFSGAAIVLTRGHVLTGLPDWVSDIGDWTLFEVVPGTLLVFVVAALLLTYLLQATRFGAELRLLGTNPLAARYAGLSTRRLIVRTYLLAGVLAAMAGLVVLSRVNSANADYGGSYLLFVILINVLAGVDPNGGFGSVGGIVLAVLTLQLMQSGLQFLSLNTFARDLLFGGLLILVMAMKAVLGAGLATFRRMFT
jgi:simple sugar transport system permease protein